MPDANNTLAQCGLGKNWLCPYFYYGALCYNGPFKLAFKRHAPSRRLRLAGRADNFEHMKRMFCCDKRIRARGQSASDDRKTIVCI